jgi:hypothetical protein
MNSATFFILSVLSSACVVRAETAEAGANPIRKIVTLLQNMQKEVTAEGDKEKELFDKFMCFCSGNSGELTKKEADVKAEIDELTATLKASKAEKVQLTQDLAAHKSDRDGAAADIEAATTLRAKEAAEYAAEKADSEYNIAAMAKAIPAIESGMGAAALLQMPGADRLKHLVQSYGNVDSMDRRDIMAFFQQSDGYAPQSGQIVGILKGMKDDMEAELAKAVADDEAAAKGFADLKASKTTEIKMATEAIISKTQRSGDAAVTVSQTANALDEAGDELVDTQKFLSQLATECKTKEKEFADRSLVRAEEVKSISDAISILNDDDALDVFKAARGAAFTQKDQLGFLQTSNNQASAAKKAQAVLAAAAEKKGSSAQLKLLLFTLSSKVKTSSKGLGSVITMIDEMIVLLGKDQAGDDSTKTFCEDELEKSADEQKAASGVLAQAEAAISELSDGISASAEKIATLEADITALDKAVADATSQRKEEHDDFQASQQLNQAATELIEKAQQRLQKFYNPTLYKAPPKTERTMEGKIIDAGTFAQVRSHRVLDEDLTFDTYKKSEKSAGVIGLMDMMIKEIATDMKDAAYEEKTSAADYAKLMAGSEESRKSDSKLIITVTSTKADLEAKLEAAKEKKMATETDLDLIASATGDLHMQCDFLLQNYALRAEARTNEIESLKTAKAILSGASFR